jgi:hypothetical protein
VLSILTGETGQCSLLYVPHHPSAQMDDLKLTRTSTRHLTVAPEVPGPQLPILGSNLATGPHSAPNLVCRDYAGAFAAKEGILKFPPFAQITLLSVDQILVIQVMLSSLTSMCSPG